MNKKLNSTFCTLAVTAMVSVAMLSGCSGTTAAPGASDTDQASTTAVAGGDKSMGEASMEAENTDAGIESKDTDGQKLKVMASFYPMYDFAVKIGGDKAEVTNMVPAGTEPHDWEPAAADIKNLEEAALFVYSGGDGALGGGCACQPGNKEVGIGGSFRRSYTQIRTHS